VTNQEKIAPSIIEKTRVALEPLARRARAPKGQSHILDFGMQHQLHSNWCWAAVATSVALFYDPNSQWTQCGVVNRTKGKRGCCGKGVSRDCNSIGHLQKTLQLVGHGRRPSYHRGKILFSRAWQEIDAGRPIGVRTQWRGSKIGHVLAIIGYHRGLELLTVADPHYGRSHVHYRVFCRDYRGSGEWTRSYYTK
jgi:hypothetical protein